MSEKVWKWQPRFVSPTLLLKMKYAEKENINTGYDDLIRQKPTIPEDYRTPPRNLGPEFIYQKKFQTSELTSQISSLKNERQEDERNMSQNVHSLPVKIRNKDKSQKSLIDYICIPEILEHDISNLEIKDDCPYDFSDHYPIYMSLNIDLLCGSSGSSKLGRHVLKWTKADEFEIKMYQTEIDKILDIIKPKIDNCTINDLEHYNTVLTNALHMSANAYIPCGKFRHYLKPYWKSNDLNAVHYEQREARREWKNNNKPRNKSNRLYKEYKEKRIFRKRKRQAEKLWREEKYEDIKNAAEVDIGEFFRTARKMRKQGPTTDKLVYDDTEAKTPGDICMLWGKYFENLYSIKEENCFDKQFYGKISKKVHDLFNNKYKGYIDTLDKPITVDEIKDQVRTLKAGKSPGQDYISNEHILYGGENILKHLSVLYNLILEQEYLPLSFRHGIVIPLYKGNNKDKTNPNSYRAVTLTSSLGKLFDKIILNRIHKLLVNINSVMPHPLQFGFVKEHGAIPAIYTLKEAIHYYLERNSIVYAIFLDNEKAFDRVWQDGLLYKLNQIGIQGKLWNLIYMSYKTATAHVQHSGLTSQVFRIEQGVGQGRVLSAWLFSLFINDLICELLSTHCGLLVGPISIPTILLADDTTLLSATVNGAQTLLNVVNSYALKWRLKYNASKSSVLTFTPPKRLATIMTLQHVLT
ncbi:unnamed protein product [Mytilus edulis]|uniref:Reverse transcriptase domain-containing protein n=2 Tax=Mytilus edulis TaxID=6550 RepID=A0A8S3U2L8_MYTED|nr:unnamed protein product [Mytilus edulis]